MWQQILVGYTASGLVAYVAIMLGTHFNASTTAAAVVQKMRENIDRRLEANDLLEAPIRFRNIKDTSAKCVAHLGVALMVIVMWPVAIGCRVRNWLKDRIKAAQFRRKVITSGVPLLACKEISPEEKIYVVAYASEDSWIWNVSEFYDLVVPAIDLILTSLHGVGDPFFDEENLWEYLALDSDAAKLFCDQKMLSERDRARLMRWANWSKSAEAKGVEEFFQQKWNEQNRAALGTGRL